MVRMVTLLAAAVWACVALAQAAAAAEVNVYSARKEALIRPLLDMFTADTGIEVNLVTGDPGQLHQRLVSEGRNSPADVFFTADAGHLHRAKTAGLLQPVRSEILEAATPARWRDPDGHWFGFSLRARVLVYARDRVSVDDLSTYEALADPAWEGRILVRSSSNIYNQSLIASMIEASGTEATEAWARGLAANMARRPRGGDTDQIRGVAAGEGDVALVNTYYYGGLAASSDAGNQAVIAATGLYFPNQSDRGTHVNVSGAGLCAHAPHPEAAAALLEYLSGERAQAVFAELNHEIPVRAGTPLSDIVAGWGEFRMDDLPLAVLGERNREAIELADRAGWR